MNLYRLTPSEFGAGITASGEPGTYGEELSKNSGVLTGLTVPVLRPPVAELTGSHICISISLAYIVP